jgi:hypothetical protein
MLLGSYQLFEPRTAAPNLSLNRSSISWQFRPINGVYEIVVIYVFIVRPDSESDKA